MKKTGAEIVVDALQQEGCEILFGYPGGQVIPLFDALHHVKTPRVILTRHEQAAAHAADGYARATGKVGVCLATSGPGATNLVTGLGTAYLDSIPMVAITGQVPTAVLGSDAFQEVDIVGITRPVTKHNFLVKSIAELPRILKEAFFIARTGRPGPVLVDIPSDITKSSLDNYEYPTEVNIRSYRPNTVGHLRQIKKAAEMIAAAQKPLVFAGGGVILSGAEAELMEFVEKTNIPVTTSLMGIGGFPGTHRLFIGMPGMHGSKVANNSLQETDLIIAVGARFDDRVTGYVKKFAPNAKIIHMDIDPAAISKIIAVDVPVVGDAKNILTELNKIIAPRSENEWNRKVMAAKGDRLFTYQDSETVIKPQKVLERLYALTKGNALLTTEVGQHQMWTAHYYLFDTPRSLITSGGLGTMGFGLPAAMGVALAFPDRTVIDIAGDGSIQMNIQELATIAIENIPVKVLILNNGYLGMVRQWQELFYGKRYSSTCLHRSGGFCDVCPGPEACPRKYVPDFVKLSEAYSIPAFRAEVPGDIDNVLTAALAVKGPAVMEFIVAPEENVFPMVPAGRSIDEIMEA